MWSTIDTNAGNIESFLRLKMSIKAVQERTGIHWNTIKRLHMEMMEEKLEERHKELKKSGYKPKHLAVDETLQWLKEHNHELTDRIRRGKYTPKPVRRVEIPKPDSGIRKLSIPTVTARILQQAMAQQMIPIFEPLFSEGSFGYRPGRSAKDAILKV